MPDRTDSGHGRDALDAAMEELVRLHTQGTSGEGDLLVHVRATSRCGDITDGVAFQFENRKGAFVVAHADLIALARALLAEPGEGYTCPVCEVPTIPVGARCPQCNETFWTPEELKPIWVSPRSRAEAEAMVDALGLSAWKDGRANLVKGTKETDDARAALVAALTGGEG